MSTNAIYTNIVVGTNGSETAAKAVAHAADLAEAYRATLHLVSSMPAKTIATGAATGPLVIDCRDEVDAILEQAAKAVQRDGLTVRTHAMQIDPAQAVVDVAERCEADLVVVGNKGMKGAKRFLLGSVPNSVAHAAPCAVLIVKTC
jgi:nucleotide-binding universal stress UspA family protein